MKRWIFKLVVFLLLGAATTIATSWYFAAGRTKDGEWFGHAEQGYSRIGPIGAGSWMVYRNERLGQVLVRSYCWLAVPNLELPRDLGPAERVLPAWASDLAPLEPPESSWSDDAAVESAGWPAVAMRTRYDVEWRRVAGLHPLQPSIRITEGILLTPKAAARRADLLYTTKALPLRPLWPGFAINTLFYAAILWLLILGPFTARRMIRRKRGQCSKCGYDLRGAEHEVCPECGADGSR